MQRARILLALLILLVAALPATALAQEGLAYERFDVEVTLNDDATFSVRAIQSVRFDGEYEFATLEIPMLDRAQSIDVSSVNECADGPTCADARPLRFTTSQETPFLFVEWDFDVSAAGEVRTFAVDYLVTGGLWVYDDNDVLIWPAIPAGRSGLPVELGTVTVTLPDGAAGSIEANVASGNGAVEEVEGSRVTFTVGTPLPDGEPFEVEVIFPHGIVPAVQQPWQRAAEELALEARVESIDVLVAIQPDGRLQVTEEHRYAVDAGTLYGGFRSLSQIFMDGIEGISVASNGEPLLPSAGSTCDNCFEATFTGSSGPWVAYDERTGEVAVDKDAAARMELDWSILPGVPAGDVADFTIDYTIAGALRMSDTAQIANLELLPDFDSSVDSATLTILPPPGVAADALRVDSASAMSDPEQLPGGAVRYTNLDLPEQSPRWQVEIVLPPDATTAQAPQWQQQFDQAVAAAEAAQVALARRDVVWSTSGILAMVASIGGIIWAWMRFGRKSARARAGGYSADLPSDLAPGIVAYLMDRNTSERGVLASLFHLATAGALEMDLSDGVKLRRRLEGVLAPNATLKPAAVEGQPAPAPLPLAAHQIMLYNDVVLPNVPTDRFVAVDDLAAPLREKLPALFAQMGTDAQAYFLNPGKASGGLGCLELGAVAALVLGGWILAFSLDVSGATRWLLMLGMASLVVFFIVLRAMRPAGKRRSESGEKEAARWTLFRNYLLNIQEFGDLAAAQEIVDRHFAYAVALGTEEVVLKQATAMGGSVPPWMWVPMMQHGPRPLDSTPSSQLPAPQMGGLQPIPAGAAAGPKPPRPTLSSASADLGGSVSRGSATLGRTLAAATGVAAATVVMRSQLQDRPMQWTPDASPAKMLDDVMKQSMADTQSIRTRPAPSSGGGSRPGGGGGGPTWGSGSSSGGSSRSSGGFSSRSSSSRSSSSRSSGSRSSGSRSSGRSGGFGKR